MTLEQAQILDEILKKFPTDDATTVIKAASKSEFYTVCTYLEVLQNQGYIKILGGMGNEKAIMLLAAGRAFIMSGGYTAIVKKEIKKEENEQTMMSYLHSANQVANSQPKENSSNRKWIWAILFIASATYFLFTKDSNKESWDSINTYVSILGGISGIIGFIKS